MKKIWNFLKGAWRWDLFWFYLVLTIAGLPILWVCAWLKLGDWASAGVLAAVWSPFIIIRILKDVKEEEAKNDLER